MCWSRVSQTVAGTSLSTRQRDRTSGSNDNWLQQTIAATKRRLYIAATKRRLYIAATKRRLYIAATKRRLYIAATKRRPAEGKGGLTLGRSSHLASRLLGGGICCRPVD